MKDLNRQLQSQGSGPWPANRVASLERSLGELSRMLESKVGNNLKNLLQRHANMVHFNLSCMLS